MNEDIKSSELVRWLLRLAATESDEHPGLLRFMPFQCAVRIESLEGIISILQKRMTEDSEKIRALEERERARLEKEKSK